MNVKVIRALLLGAEAVTARVADRVAAGDVAVDEGLPAIGLTEVVAVPIGAFDAQAEFSIVTSRVQVTVVGKPYPDVVALINLARRACNCDTVGPDMEDVAGNSIKTIDFKVTYHEPN
jgi:hypothetical protein